jgi:hypothetical protein
MSGSKRTESYWTRSQIFDKTGTTQIAETLLNHAVMKNSYPDYEKELAAKVG